jgi:endonuclease YncB( thermonuclease family)
MVIRLAFAAAILLALTIGRGEAIELNGPARMIDGDTIDIGGQRIRLYGIYAPEGGQTCERSGQRYDCGQESAWALAELIEKHWVLCVERDRDRYGRVVATCYVGGRNGIDLGAHMVRSGWAVAFRRYSSVYEREETHAKSEVRGLWAGNFDFPWDWRLKHRSRGEAAKRQDMEGKHGR